MEDPEYCKVHSHYSTAPIDNIKVFIIDDGCHTTAMHAEDILKLPGRVEPTIRYNTYFIALERVYLSPKQGG